MRGPSRSYPVSRDYKCKTLKFGFSDWIMSPSVDLTFSVSYTFSLQNNIMGSSVIYLSLSEIPIIWTHQRQFGLKLI